MFENDVNQYGTQAKTHSIRNFEKFENDVNQYGTQAKEKGADTSARLRMM